MKEVSEDKENDVDDEIGNGSDISGYHSDSESAVMTSGNSPFISKEARYSFLSRSGKATPNDILYFWSETKLNRVVQVLHKSSQNSTKNGGAFRFTAKQGLV